MRPEALLSMNGIRPMINSELWDKGSADSLSLFNQEQTAEANQDNGLWPIIEQASLRTRAGWVVTRTSGGNR